MSDRDDSGLILREGCEKLGAGIGEAEVVLFLTYLEELQRWNRRINLTAIKGERAIVVRHFLDSVSLVPLLRGRDTLLDIGSGAGMPGIPVKIVLPELKVFLLDSSVKKTNFTRHIIRKLSLKGISTINKRAEIAVMMVEFMGVFDVVVSRAFSNLAQFLKIASGYVKDEGIVVAVKGPAADAEIDGLNDQNSAWGLSLIDIKDVSVPFSRFATKHLIFRKIVPRGTK